MSVSTSLFSRGVDIFEQFCSKYLVGRPLKKWWKYVLFFLINTAVIDPFLIKKGYVRFQTKKYKQLDFRLALTQLLIGMFRTPRSAPVRRQQSMLTTTHKFVKLTNKDRMARIAPRLFRMDVDYVKFICAASSVLLYFTII